MFFQLNFPCILDVHGWCMHYRKINSGWAILRYWNNLPVTVGDVAPGLVGAKIERN